MSYEKEEIELNEVFLTDLEQVLDKHEDMDSVEVVVQLLAMAYSIMHEIAPSPKEGYKFIQSILEKMCLVEDEEESFEEEEED